jgi:hypothetical protein
MALLSQHEWCAWNKYGSVCALLFPVPLPGWGLESRVQLFTIRDPLEVKSAKLRRFVLIPIEKLKLSRVGHGGTQMMSFLFLSVVRPLRKCHSDTVR